MSEYSNIAWCDWCVADSGRSHATRPCCVARRVSHMMPVARFRALADERARCGDAAGDALRGAVLRSMSLRIAKLAKAARMEAYRVAMRNGWLPDDLEALKRMTKEEFDRGQADGS